MDSAEYALNKWKFVDLSSIPKFYTGPSGPPVFLNHFKNDLWIKKSKFIRL